MVDTLLSRCYYESTPMPLALVPSELQPLRAQVRRINETLEDRSLCFYCGESATCEDHVIPHSLLHREGVSRKGWEVDTLPACQECNALLGAKVFNTLEERKAHLARKLRVRHAKAIRHTPLTESELVELGSTLHGYSVRLNLAHSCIMQRLATLEGRTLPPVDHIPTPVPVLSVLTLRARDIEVTTHTSTPKAKRKRKPKTRGRVWTYVRYDTRYDAPTLAYAKALREPIPVNDASRWVQDENGQWDFITKR